MRNDTGYSNVTVEDFLDYEGIEYRPTSGSRGPQFNIQECPSCGGREWKVYLSQETGFGNCFHGKCGESYNLWTFAKAYLNTADSKAVGELFDRIAKTAGWRPKKRKEKADALVAAANAAPVDVKLPMSLPIPAENIPYLADRGVTAAQAAEFGLRNCINGAYFYTGNEGKAMTQPYTGRLIIPIFDVEGKLVTFQGRDMTGQLDPKYLFPPKLASTGRIIFNGHIAKQRRWQHAVMGEGAFDVMAIQAALDADYTLGNIGAVGSFGKKLSLDTGAGAQSQLQSLLALKEAGLRKITIMWDGEPTALAAALDAGEVLTSYGFEVCIALLPRGCDPAEVEPSVVIQAIRDALPYKRSLAVRLRLKNPYR